MVSDRGVRNSHVTLYVLVLLSSIVALAISASLVSHYNAGGYPPEHTTAYKDRIRILLVAAVWMTFFAILLIPGFLVAGRSAVFGLLTHLVPTAIGFILFLIGVASLTALTDKVDCGKSGETFDRCNIVKGLVIISWIDTIFIFVTLIMLIVLAFIARGEYGVHRSTLYVD
ncbi:hypothetical protein Q5752_004249 [Cryptotrichosporon argae]